MSASVFVHKHKHTHKYARNISAWGLNKKAGNSQPVSV